MSDTKPELPRDMHEQAGEYLRLRKERGAHTFMFDHGAVEIELEVSANTHDPSLGTSSQVLARAVDIPEGSYICDMCAGTGVQGILALYAGATRVDFGDKNPYAVADMKRNLAKHTFGADRARVFESDVFDQFPAETMPYDSVLLNSPFLFTEETVSPDDPNAPFVHSSFDPHYQLLQKFFGTVGDRLAENGKIQTVLSQAANTEEFGRIVTANGFAIQSTKEDSLYPDHWFVHTIGRK
ncbi:MAG: methyltransferase [Candidatus Woesearchaeota archaeon]|nr:methyltransferase [Candidatus Woesearchaeota archaeon]